MKKPLSVFLIVGLLFSAIGGPFMCMGIWMFFNMDFVQTHGTGDIRLLPVMFTGLGAIFFFIGIALIFVEIRSRNERKKLIAGGVYVMAEISGYVEDYSVTVNGCPGIRAICLYDDASTGQQYTFSSDAFWTYPNGLQPGSMVKVYVDRNNFSNYYVDIECVSGYNR